jgi:hypothetical protein
LQPRAAACAAAKPAQQCPACIAAAEAAKGSALQSGPLRISAVSLNPEPNSAVNSCDKIVTRST